MIRRICLLILFVLTSHWLYAQRPMRKDTCRTIPKQEHTKSVEPLDSTKFKKCPLCSGQGTIRKEVGTQYVVIVSKGKKEYARCGEEYRDNIRHYHVERCVLCAGLGYRWKRFY
jgi:hypothetical protein